MMKAKSSEIGDVKTSGVIGIQLHIAINQQMKELGVVRCLEIMK